MGPEVEHGVEFSRGHLGGDDGRVAEPEGQCGFGGRRGVAADSVAAALTPRLDVDGDLEGCGTQCDRCHRHADAAGCVGDSSGDEIGQRIELSWKIADDNLDDLPGQVYSRKVEDGRVPQWEVASESLAATGKMSLTIEQLPSRVKGVQFRVQAKDQMGNVATGYSPLLELSYPLAGSARSSSGL